MKKVQSKMKVILRADVDNLGRLGDVVEVKPGYARNYLLPQGFAMQASEGNLKAFDLERRKLQARMDAIRAEAQTIGDKLAAADVVIPVRVGEGDKLYGSVTSAAIGDALEAMGIEVDRRKLVLEEPIRALGAYTIPVKLHPDVAIDLSVKVIRHGVTEEEAMAEITAPSPEEVAELAEEEVPAEAEAYTVEDAAEDVAAEEPAAEAEEEVEG